ncbi:MAG: aminopeptidase P family protein [Thermomicrobiales bacterium]|nr:aminopeptidase P family protein [Thermomicrobiales bacterium]MCO5221650.1 Xaa-Pro peptidase family protein [Thermomicrobiales bacterium]
MTSRIEQIREVLVNEGWDAILISDQDNRYFASGYRAEDHSGRSAGVLVITPDAAQLYTNPNNLDWAKSAAPAFEAVKAGPLWEQEVAESLKAAGVEKLGVETATLPHASFVRLSDHLDGVAIVAVRDQLDRLRWIKTPEEIAYHRKAIAITDRAYERALAALTAGVTEREIANLIAIAFLEQGADGWGFPPTVAFGPNAAKPHHDPGDRKLERGEAIIMDIGATVRGYTADLTRTNWLGEPPAQLAEIYTIVQSAQDAAFASVRAGTPASAVDRAARAVIEEAGYGEQFVHGLGHGIGVRIHDGPFLHRRNDDPIPANSILTIEPGIYIRDFGGVRIEDVVLVTDEGYELLTHAPKRPQLV